MPSTWSVTMPDPDSLPIDPRVIARPVGWVSAAAASVTMWSVLPWGLAAAAVVWCSPVAAAARRGVTVGVPPL